LKQQDFGYLGILQGTVVNYDVANQKYQVQWEHHEISEHSYDDLTELLSPNIDPQHEPVDEQPQQMQQQVVNEEVVASVGNDLVAFDDEFVDATTAGIVDGYAAAAVMNALQDDEDNAVEKDEQPPNKSDVEMLVVDTEEEPMKDGITDTEVYDTNVDTDHYDTNAYDSDTKMMSKNNESVVVDDDDDDDDNKPLLDALAKRVKEEAPAKPKRRGRKPKEENMNGKKKKAKKKDRCPTPLFPVGTIVRKVRLSAIKYDKS
jgi:hypothetical protein